MRLQWPVIACFATVAIVLAIIGWIVVKTGLLAGLRGDDDADAIIREIEQAFADVQRGKIPLHEAQAMDDYAGEEERATARKLDTDSRWEDVPDQHIVECPDALSYFDPESWRYYLPRYMVWSLRNYRTTNSMIPDWTIYELYLNSDNLQLHERNMQRFRQLNEQQAAAVSRFLRYMVTNGFPETDPAANEAMKYWGKFCPDR